MWKAFKNICNFKTLKKSILQHGQRYCWLINRWKINWITNRFIVLLEKGLGTELDYLDGDAGTDVWLPAAAWARAATRASRGAGGARTGASQGRGRGRGQGRARAGGARPPWPPGRAPRRTAPCNRAAADAFADVASATSAAVAAAAFSRGTRASCLPPRLLLEVTLYC